MSKFYSDTTPVGGPTADIQHDLAIEEPQLEFDDGFYVNAAVSSSVGEEASVVYDGQDEILDAEAAGISFDDDFEVQLGSAAKVQDEELAESEFHDISKFGVVELAGDDMFGRKVVVFSSCRLPVHSQIDHTKLLKYLQHTLDQYVESDYTLVYFHYGLKKQNKPSYKWLLAAYRELDRKYKKNLKAMYIVHPTTFIKVMWRLFSPLISAKFGQKITYVNYLHELKDHLPVAQLKIPDAVKMHDEELAKKHKAAAAAKGSQLFSAGRPAPPKSTQQFQVPLDASIAKSPDGEIPPVVRKCVEYLEQHGMTVKGLFRRSALASSVREVQALFNNGRDVDFEALGGAHLAAVILKTFLRELPEPLLTYELYDYIIRIHTLERDEQATEAKRILNELPASNYRVLKYIVSFLVKFAGNSAVNMMTERNLAIVFAPNLLWPRSQASLLTIQHTIAFTDLLLQEHALLFCD